MMKSGLRQLLVITLTTLMKCGLTAKPRTHTRTVAMSTPRRRCFRPCILELLRGPGCACGVGRWCSEALYTSYVTIPGLRYRGSGRRRPSGTTGRSRRSYPHSDGGRVYETSLTPVSSSGNRSRTTVGTVWTGTMDNHPKIPTARRRARTLGSALSPESPVGDVPSTMHSMVAVAAYHMRARPCREVRLTGLDEYDVLHDV